MMRFALMLLLPACSTLSPFSSSNGGEDPAERVTLWTKGDWFIALEPQDKTAGAPPANSQPLNISPSRLRAALSAIRIRGERRQSSPLFNEESLDTLSIYLSESLAKASPSQDAVFAVGTFQRRLLGVRTDLAATGRVFNNHDGLNIIIGELRSPNLRYDSEAELKALNKDTRLHPYIPGLRGIRQAQLARLSLPERRAGVFTKSKKRPDWFVFSEEGLTPTMVATPGQPGNAISGSEELTQLRQEVEELKSRLGDGQAKPGQGEVTLETKLTALRELRDKGLISDDSYQQKRQKLLEEF